MAAQKKAPVAQECDEEARSAFRERVEAVDPGRFVLVDECGTHTSMARLRDRAPKGRRAYGKVPRNRGKNTTLIAPMTLQEGMGEAIVGGTDAAVFEAYVERFLAPSLLEGQIVVMDNLGAHKPGKIRELIEARGGAALVSAELLAGPQPHRGGVLEGQGAALRKAAARTREALPEAIAVALSATTPGDAAGWFDHCGYGSRAQGL